LGYAYISRNYEFIILLNFNLPDKFETPYEFIIHQSEEISGIVRRHSGSLPVRSSRISTGNIYKSILFAASSYKQAEISLKRKFFDESQEFFYAWKDKSSLINAFFEYPYESENQLLNALMEGDAKKSASGFRAFWEAFDPALRHLEPETIQNYALQLLNIIDRRLSKHKTSLGEIINIYPPFLSFINAFRSHNELEIALSGVISRVAAGLGSLNSKSRSSSYPCILKAKKFIEEHYNEKITLNQTAESVFLNPSYFSILFKKETGSNFVDYLKEFRITKAIELLNRVDLKIYEIGRLVGYEDPTYFTNTFKNFTGITPLEYKRKLPGE
jgi:two-component system response regulator YesN